MTILRSGSTKNYSDNWGKAFGESTKKSKSKKSKPKAEKKKKAKKKKKKK